MRSSLGLPIHHRPDGFDVFAAASIQPIVQIHGRVAVRWDKLDPLPKPWRAFVPGNVEIAELVSAPAVAQPRKSRRLGAVSSIGGKSLESGIHGHKPVVI